MAARLMALDFQYLEIDGVEFDTYWQNGGYKKISDIIFAEWHIFIVSNLCPGATCCSMTCVDFARAAWINSIDFIVQTKAPGYEAGCFVTFCHSEASEITSSHGGWSKHDVLPASIFIGGFYFY
jgi:hypothetical protein